MSINWQMEFFNPLVYPYNGILRNKKEQIIEMPNNIGESQIQCPKK